MENVLTIFKRARNRIDLGARDVYARISCDCQHRLCEPAKPELIWWDAGQTRRIQPKRTANYAVLQLRARSASTLGTSLAD